MSDDEQPRRGRGRRREATQFSNSSGIATAITTLLTLHKNRGHIKEAEVKKIIPEFNELLRSNIADKMNAVFGLTLASDTDTKTSYLYSDVRFPPQCKFLGSHMPEHLEDEEDGFCEMEEAFLIVVLIVVLMNSSPPSAALPRGSGLRLTTLINILDEAALSPPTHLGDISKYIDGTSTAQFVSRGWLTFQNETVDGERQTTIFWGSLANATLRPMHLLELYCTLVDSEPSEYIDVYKYAKKVEETRGAQPSRIFLDEAERSDDEGEVTQQQSDDDIEMDE
ncbi:hypothetical protein QR680_008566 [Steinernema hermaphroditum]|uniref:MAGE domain-containing protein n=1 Tax=Steinernema hermaphroditum TaxID=289476 RepID=A0AA39IH26_9BILA|nr:hypothetical protein QR680_008566 [Steinernema hermaphroditum]